MEFLINVSSKLSRIDKVHKFSLNLKFLSRPNFMALELELSPLLNTFPWDIDQTLDDPFEHEGGCVFSQEVEQEYVPNVTGG